MALVLSAIYDKISYFYYSRDRRQDDLFLVRNAAFCYPLIVGSYILFVKHGPKFMKNRKAFDLKNVMMIYNLLQVIVNTALGIYGIYHGILHRKIKLICHPVDYAATRDALIDARLVYYYMLLKISDLLDTVFMVLRKNNKQISFLHVYHHAIMTTAGFVGTLWMPGGAGLWVGLVNLFVHSVMYTYYFLTAFKPELKKSIWWKRNITQIQMAQFIFLATININGVFEKNCPFPKFWLVVLGFQNLFMLFMFADFYRKAYFKRKQQ